MPAQRAGNPARHLPPQRGSHPWGLGPLSPALPPPRPPAGSAPELALLAPGWALHCRGLNLPYRVHLRQTAYPTQQCPWTNSLAEIRSRPQVPSTWGGLGRAGESRQAAQGVAGEGTAFFLLGSLGLQVRCPLQTPTWELHAHGRPPVPPGPGLWASAPERQSHVPSAPVLAWTRRWVGRAGLPERRWATSNSGPSHWPLRTPLAWLGGAGGQVSVSWGEPEGQAGRSPPSLREARKRDGPRSRAQSARSHLWGSGIPKFRGPGHQPAVVQANCTRQLYLSAHVPRWARANRPGPQETRDSKDRAGEGARTEKRKNLAHAHPATRQPGVSSLGKCSRRFFALPISQLLGHWVWRRPPTPGPGCGHNLSKVIALGSSLLPGPLEKSLQDRAELFNPW